MHLFNQIPNIKLRMFIVSKIILKNISLFWNDNINQIKKNNIFIHFNTSQCTVNLCTFWYSALQCVVSGRTAGSIASQCQLLCRSVWYSVDKCIVQWCTVGYSAGQSPVPRPHGDSVGMCGGVELHTVLVSEKKVVYSGLIVSVLCSGVQRSKCW